MFSFLLLIFRLVFCSETEIEYEIYIDCNIDKIKEAGFSVTEEIISFHEFFDFDQKRKLSNADLSLKYHILDFFTQKIADIQRIIEKSDAFKQPGQCPLVLKFSAYALNETEVTYLKEQYVAFARVANSLDRAITLIDIRRSKISLIDLLDVIRKSKKKNYFAIKKEPLLLLFQRQAAFVLCRASDTDTYRDFYEKCKSTVVAGIFDQVEKNENLPDQIKCDPVEEDSEEEEQTGENPPKNETPTEEKDTTKSKTFEAKDDSKKGDDTKSDEDLKDGSDLKDEPDLKDGSDSRAAKKAPNIAKSALMVLFVLFFLRA